MPEEGGGVRRLSSSDEIYRILGHSVFIPADPPDVVADRVGQGLSGSFTVTGELALAFGRSSR